MHPPPSFFFLTETHGKCLALRLFGQLLSFIHHQDDFHCRVCGCQWAAAGLYVFMAGKNHLFLGLIWSGPWPVYQRWQSKYLKTNVSVQGNQYSPHDHTAGYAPVTNKFVNFDNLIASTVHAWSCISR